MNKVLVTGAHGFIGHYVVEKLLEDGHEVIAFDHHQNALAEWDKDVEIFLGDMRDEVAMTEAMAHAEGWIHLAAVLGTQETIQNPRPAAITNVVGGLNVLEAGAQYDLPGVYICVGNYWMNNTYSITKTTVERFVNMFVKDRGSRINNVRVVNAYGPRQVAAPPYGPSKVRKIIPAFACRAIAGHDVEVYGDGEQVSDMVYVEDVANVLVTALRAADAGDVVGEKIEVGPTVSNTVNEVAECVIDAAGTDVDIVHLPMRPGEIAGDSVTADTDTLRVLGIDPEWLLPMEVGIQKTVEWYAENEGITWSRP